MKSPSLGGRLVTCAGSAMHSGIWAAAILFALCISILRAEVPSATEPAAGPKLTLGEMQRRVADASKAAPPWDGPRSGPAGVEGKTIAIICEDLRNGGVLGVAQGILEAANTMKWTLRVFDASGTPSGRDRAAASALACEPDGLILIGVDSKTMRSSLEPFAVKGVPVVGWHVAPKPGPVPNSPVAMNVSTDPLEVARITAMAALVASKGQAGVVIFTDSNFEIALAKSEAMAQVVRESEGCTLLEIVDIPISKSAEMVPKATRELIARYGRRWTHAFAINDIYFAYAVPELTTADLPEKNLSLLSAGDGSADAFLRIEAGIFQTATVAEPLNLHGWQLVDEMNRLLSRQPVSGYVAAVHLVKLDNVSFDGGPRLGYDPDNGYRSIYRSIWKR